MRKNYIDELLTAMNSKKEKQNKKLIGTKGADGKYTSFSADDLKAIAKALEASTKRIVAKRTLAEERKAWFRKAVGAEKDKENTNVEDKISMNTMVACLWQYAMDNKADFARWYKKQNAADSTVQESDNI